MMSGREAERSRALPGPFTLPPLALLLMATIAIGWGINWPAMKIALGEFEPFTFRALCALIAAGSLLLLTAVRGERVGLRLRQVGPLALIAVFSVTGWQMLTATGLLLIESSRAVIIAFTMPLWATLLSVLFLGERLSRLHLVALALGTLALLLLLGEEIAAVGTSPLGSLLMTGGAMCWAAGTVLVKWLDLRIPVMAFTAWQLVIGVVPILIGALLLEPWPAFGAISMEAWVGLAIASLIGMVLCVTSYFKLVRLVPASVAATATLAVPVVGVISSAIWLGEAVGWAEIAALVLVVSGLFLLVWSGRRRELRSLRPPAAAGPRP